MLSEKLSLSLIKQNIIDNKPEKINNLLLEYLYRIKTLHYLITNENEFISFEIDSTSKINSTFVDLCIGLGIGNLIWKYYDKIIKFNLRINNLPFHLLLNGMFFEKILFKFGEIILGEKIENYSRELKDMFKCNNFQYDFSMKLKNELNNYPKRKIKLFLKLMLFLRDLFINGIYNINDKKIEFTKRGETVVSYFKEFVNILMKTNSNSSIIEEIHHDDPSLSKFHFRMNEKKIKVLLLFILNHLIDIDFNYISKSFDEKDLICYKSSESEKLLSFIKKITKKSIYISRGENKFDIYEVYV